MALTVCVDSALNFCVLGFNVEMLVFELKVVT